mmetsp:Transcript_18866/g.56573  ORF Transcript_18866/g.56573 Transcript_18866/m.56573 type:complete len:435 (-) Transcript_18866:50-1354(-)|eukprot:CAMPEP_0177648180 /NCGR_PEP_ID=MMETSP0447-20121125/10693_1 /TAXON_ID=0 /ORGANISM="Stygamoeba regulata, Strain BSH-02190019" /LENGTH=434 /DNA_ID=CAMNT_0019150809 /DNA_START=49 /DNA_END=1353 /DNA_ORIENTATION=+
MTAAAFDEEQDLEMLEHETTVAQQPLLRETAPSRHRGHDNISHDEGAADRDPQEKLPSLPRKWKRNFFMFRVLTALALFSCLVAVAVQLSINWANTERDPPVSVDQTYPADGLSYPTVVVCHADSSPESDIAVTMTPDSEGNEICIANTDGALSEQSVILCEINKFALHWSLDDCGADGFCSASCVHVAPDRPDRPVGSSCNDLVVDVVTREFLDAINFEMVRTCVAVNFNDQIPKVTNLRQSLSVQLTISPPPKNGLSAGEVFLVPHGEAFSLTDRSFYIDVAEWSRVTIRQYEEKLIDANRVFWEWENSGADLNQNDAPVELLTLVISYSSLFLTVTVQGSDYGFVNYIGELGGWFGILLGWSIYGFLDLIEQQLLPRIIWARRNRRRFWEYGRSGASKIKGSIGGSLSRYVRMDNNGNTLDRPLLDDPSPL